MALALVKISFVLVGILQFVYGNTRNASTSSGILLEETIYNNLFGNYNAEIRPKGKAGKPLKVLYDLTVQTIHSLDVKTQVLTITAFTFMKWNDTRLQWNSSDYEDIDTLTVGNHIVWTPDVVLYNDAKEQPQGHLELYKSKVLIKSTGEVTWATPVMWKATCSVDVTWFPVDMQICNITFGSWSYSNKVLDLKFRNKQRTTETLKTEYHVPSGEWLLKKIQFYEENMSFDCCPRPFSTITLSLELIRYPEFYYVYVFYPFLSQVFLFLLIFHIQPEHGDRLSFGVALLLNMTMYMIFLSDKLPEKSDNRPFIGTLFVTLFFMLSFGLGLSAITMMLSKRETPLPSYANKLKRFLYTILLKIQKFCGCCCNDKESRKSDPVRYGSYNMHPINSNVNGVPTNGDGSPHDNDSPQELAEDVAREDETAVMTPYKQPEDVGYKDFEGWSEFMRYLDKCLFFGFIFLVIFVPVLIALSLDTSKIGPP